MGMYYNLASDNCDSLCKTISICNNHSFFFFYNNVETCVLYHNVLYRNSTPFVTAYNDQNIYYTLDQCSKLCDNTQYCNLILYMIKEEINNNKTVCSLFSLVENATVNNII